MMVETRHRTDVPNSPQRARSDMEVFVGAFVHSTDDSPMVVLPGMVMGVLNTKVRCCPMPTSFPLAWNDCLNFSYPKISTAFNLHQIYRLSSWRVWRNWTTWKQSMASRTPTSTTWPQGMFALIQFRKYICSSLNFFLLLNLSKP